MSTQQIENKLLEILNDDQSIDWAMVSEIPSAEEMTNDYGCDSVMKVKNGRENGYILYIKSQIINH